MVSRASVIPPLDPVVVRATARAIDNLSAREREVLSVMLTGCTGQQAAPQLGIAFRTVQVHMTRIMKRLGVKRFSEAILYVAAAEWGRPKPVEEKSVTPTKRLPKVATSDSVQPDYIVCLECGDRCKLLKRHLRDHHGLTAAQYLVAWDLPADYPMVTANHSRLRSDKARRDGLAAAAHSRTWRPIKAKVGG